MKTFQAFTNEVSKREGKKESVNQAQINEIVGIVADLYNESPEEVTEILKKTGATRAKAKAKKGATTEEEGGE